jgi:hypothetical protein
MSQNPQRGIVATKGGCRLDENLLELFRVTSVSSAKRAKDGKSEIGKIATFSLQNFRSSEPSPFVPCKKTTYFLPSDTGPCCDGLDNSAFFWPK